MAFNISGGFNRTSGKAIFSTVTGGGGAWPPPVDPTPPGGIPAGVYNITGTNYWEPDFASHPTTGVPSAPHLPYFTPGVGWEMPIWGSLTPSTYRRSIRNTNNWINQLKGGQWELFILATQLDVDGGSPDFPDFGVYPVYGVAPYLNDGTGIAKSASTVSVFDFAHGDAYKDPNNGYTYNTEETFPFQYLFPADTTNDPPLFPNTPLTRPCEIHPVPPACDVVALVMQQGSRPTRIRIDYIGLKAV